jgi:hypothetical protein
MSTTQLTRTPERLRVAFAMSWLIVVLAAVSELTMSWWFFRSCSGFNA